MNALLAQFIPEARELLENASAGLLRLEREPEAPGLVNDVFRAIHTLKGSSGLFEVKPLTDLLHAAEDLLDDVRGKELELTPDIVDELLESVDVLEGLIDSLDATEALPNDAESRTSSLIKTLRSTTGSSHAQPADPGVNGLCAPEEGIKRDWLSKFSEADRLKAYRAFTSGGAALIAWKFEPEEDCFFRGDDPLALVGRSPGLLALVIEPVGSMPDLETLDAFSCWLRFYVLSEASMEELAEHTRYVYDRTQFIAVSEDDLIVLSGTPVGGEVCADFADNACSALVARDRAGLSAAIRTIRRVLPTESYEASVLRWIDCVLEKSDFARSDLLGQLIKAVSEQTFSLPEATPGAVASKPEPAPSDERREAIRLLETQVAVLESAVGETTANGTVDAVVRTASNVLAALGEPKLLAQFKDHFESATAEAGVPPIISALHDLIHGLEIAALAPNNAQASPLSGEPPIQQVNHIEDAGPATAATKEPVSREEAKGQTRVLRVDQAKIDSLMNLVAELVVVKNALPYLSKRAEEVYGSRLMAREIKDQYGVLDRIVQGLQVGVMSVRMMPVSQVFQRFPRLVRDTARKLGKAIELAIEGEETEADKNILECLSDPLIHIVRNSIDHGIELPEERRAAGKREHGTIRLSARQENDSVYIDVVDDGKGIDPTIVKAKALKAGILTAEQASQMSDRDAVNLVFEAGFSTKDAVSDLSGRGVGMDVVRTAVQRAGGDVFLTSEKGIGTKVSLRLPLTMAVTRVVTISCGRHLFGIPMDSVVETVKIGSNAIHSIKDREAFVLRNNVVPLVRLGSTLGLAAADADAGESEVAVMVVQAGRRKAGIIVDDFKERLEAIVRPMDGILAGARMFSGTALLGDGRVLLVLNPGEILS